MNSKQDKIDLLKSIKNGEIVPEAIPANPIICANEKEMFLGLMMDSPENEEDQGHVVFVGPAKRALDKMMNEIESLPE